MLKFNNIVLKYADNWLNCTEPPDPYNPLNLPPNTIRVKFRSGTSPSTSIGDTRTLVDAENNVWDIYKASNDWNRLFFDNSYVIEVLGANTSTITNMYAMFYSCEYLTTISLFDTSSVTDMDAMFRDCRSLTSVPLYDTSSVTAMKLMFCDCHSLTTVPLFDTYNVIYMDSMFVNCTSLTTVPLFNTSSVTRMDYMFYGCTALTSVPLFDTSNVIYIDYMFKYCTNVESGALALYRQASSQSTPPSTHGQTFRYCGSNTTTGAAELAQIPSSWK